MALTVGTNSWVTIAEADAYLADTMNTDSWFILTTKQKTQRLVTAYQWINMQADLSIAASSTATVVKNAQIETALYIDGNWTQHTERRALYEQGVRDFDIMSFAEKLEGARFPDYIKQMLNDYLTAPGAFIRMTRDF